VNCGRASENDKHGHRLLGYNYRMTEFQAAILLVQLERLAEQTALREQRACRLSAQLAQIPGLCLLRKDERQTTQAIYHYVFKYNPEGFQGLDRNRFLAALQAEGIPCDGVFYEPVYRSSLFKVDTRDFPLLPDTPPWQDTRCPVAEKAAYEESIWLNHNLLLGDEEDIDDVVEAIAKVQKHAHEILDIEHHLVVLQRLNRAERDGYLKSIAAKAEPAKTAQVTPGS
jgi:dTDP-4-amino-4,6-dideoxygalactose transaminase